ncbi:MAG: hypothetical protein FJ045_04005 [Crenarchaeota archaeon]|nr:hypothetical protein [Thermoproteota archaeon]
MALSKKLHLTLRLAVVFSASFLTVFSAIFLTQSAYSTPSNHVLIVDGMDITLGPPPNSTNIPLDTTITIDALASASLNDLHMTPEVPIARVYSEVSGPLTYLNTFYPAQLLKPATSYTVSVTIMDVPVSWSFTTTSEPFNPGISFYLATNVLWIALSAAISATSIVAFVIWFFRRKQVNHKT